jgi:hypothetical protein
MSPVFEKLIDFARWVIMEHRQDCADIDGGSIQDKLVEFGLLAEVTVTEPCGENCACVEYGDFPQTCLRVIDGVLPVPKVRVE